MQLFAGEPLESRRAAFLRLVVQLSAMLYFAVALLVWLGVRTVSVPATGSTSPSTRPRWR